MTDWVVRGGLWGAGIGISILAYHAISIIHTISSNGRWTELKKL